MMVALLAWGKKFLSSPKVIVGVIIVALFTSNVYFKLRLDSVKGDRKLLQFRVSTTVDANESNQETIERLRKRNDELKDLMEISVARAGSEAATARAERDSLVAERERIQRELRAALSGTPTCEDLAALDLSALCPDFVDRLLRFYERSRQD